MSEEIKVSIIGAAFNHEKYIRNALDGIVMQKCDFRVEALIHDDASTDSTVNIIREYEEKYPDLIQGIYEEKNIYSQGKRIIREVLKQAKGEYIAICECDDYWTDENKLAIEVEFMDAHPECSGCCHAYSRLDSLSGEVTHTHLLNGDGDIVFEQIIDNSFSPHAATMLLRREILTAQPEFFSMDMTGDFPLKLWMTLNGKFHYIDRDMSCYRVMSQGSWSAKLTKDKAFRSSRLSKRIAFLTELDKYTEGKYSKVINAQLDRIRFEDSYLLGNYKAARKNPQFKKQSTAKKAFIVFGSVFPKLAIKLHDKR